MSLQWSEADPTLFDQYPGPQQKEPDELDRVVDALEEGKTVEMTLGDESAVRGRRMALGRRAKQRGFPIEMRYQGNRIIVRRSSNGQTAPSASQHSEPDEEASATAQPGRRRGRTRQ